MTTPAQAYEGRELEAAANLVNYYRWVIDGFRPYLNGAGTEIGAGIGTFSQYLRPHLTSLDAVEPSPTQYETLQACFADDAGVRVFSETIDNYHKRVGDGARDTVCMVNVLEHIEDDAAALASLHDVLGSGGHLCIFVPALPFLYSKLDKILEHFRRYTRAELESKMAAAGFDVVECKYMDVLGVPAWGLVNTLLGSTNLNPQMAALYDRAFVPVTRAVESLVTPPFGKSLLAIGRKHG